MVEEGQLAEVGGEEKGITEFHLVVFGDYDVAAA